MDLHADQIKHATNTIRGSASCIHSIQVGFYTCKISVCVCCKYCQQESQTHLKNYLKIYIKYISWKDDCVWKTSLQILTGEESFPAFPPTPWCHFQEKHWTGLPYLYLSRRTKLVLNPARISLKTTPITFKALHGTAPSFMHCMFFIATNSSLLKINSGRKATKGMNNYFPKWKMTQCFLDHVTSCAHDWVWYEGKLPVYWTSPGFFFLPVGEQSLPISRGWPRRSFISKDMHYLNIV